MAYSHLKKIAEDNAFVNFTSTNPQNGKKVFLRPEGKDKNFSRMVGYFGCERWKKNRLQVDVNEEGKFTFRTDDNMHLHKYVNIYTFFL